MRKKKLLGRVAAVLCAVAVTVTGIPVNGLSVKAASFDDDDINVMLDSGGFKTEVFGVVTDDWGVTWKDRHETLPPKTYLTDNYRETVGTVPTSDWASSVVFDRFSESLYAHPLAYRAASNGMQMANPAVVDVISGIDGEPQVESLLNDETVELVVGGDGFTAKDASVDKTTDWTYEIVMDNEAGDKSMRSILAKGTPYAYYQFTGINPTISLGAGATNLAIYKNGTSSNIIGLSLKNNKDGKMHYYLVAAPAGTTWTNAGGKLTANMPSGKRYMSVAILPDNSDAAFNLYSRYAFNFITGTTVEWEYLENASKVATRYNFETTNMETGATGGDTIMALYPHQWRYCDADYNEYTYNTIRGRMKTITGTSYITEMQYNGILSALPVTDDEETIGKIKDQLGYLYDYRKNKDDPKWIAFLEGQYGGYDTYWVGKNLNALADAITIAGRFEDEDMKNLTSDMVDGVANYMQFWFDPYQAYQSGDFVDSYFYYHKDYGTLIGYPSSYGTDKEMNDHHFHYGYWIKAAAAIAMQKPEWAQEWGGMVYEMISDIANSNRDGSSYNENSPGKYPFLRNFDIYEGHSWASGVANYEYDEDGNMIDSKGGLSGGNNQESSSEAVNAWSSLIMWGEAVGDERIRDLGIYMYTTEIAAIEDYYYDVYDEIFTDKYEDRDNYNIQTVTRLFGGRYDHTAWWTENSIEVTTITMLPLSGATLYFGKYPEKVKNVYESVGSQSKQWNNFVNNKEQICQNYGKTDMLVNPSTNQDVMAEFLAYADPKAALDAWDSTDLGVVENGESRAHTLEYISSLDTYGNQNFDITASSPMALVMEKDGVRTYVAENHSNEDIRVYYSDGAYVDVPAKTNYAGPKTGDEENPNIDEGNIAGSKQKYILEVHKENYEGTGYDVSTRTVSVKSDDNTYVYVPAEITGFTYDAGNKNNKLTVDVTEGTVETVVVYYRRNTYGIKYELDGGTAYGNPDSYRYGSQITLNSASKKGFVFEGWYTDAQFSNMITEISPSTAGDIIIYAKFMDASLMTTYKVEYYIMSDNREFYSLAQDQTDVIKSYVGTTVTAEDKAYEGYILNPNSTTTGVVLPDDQLVLRMYYDVPEKNTGILPNSENGIMVDEKNKATLYVANAPEANMVIAFYRLFNDEASARAVYANASGGNLGDLPGFQITSKDEDGIFKYPLGTVSDEQYIVYMFNIDDQKLTQAKIVKIGDAKKQAAESSKVKAGYSVHYYLQKQDLSGYSQKVQDALELEGEVLTGVVAPVNTYEGYKVNAEKSKLTGTIAEDGSLVMDIYYDIVNTSVSKHKYVLEVYLERLGTAGYDMTTRVVNVDTEDDTFTYVPEEITGYTFDKSNENNNLTVDVSEGVIETVKAYYNRNIYNIRYELNGGSSDNPETYKYGETFKLNDAVKQGAIFIGWYFDDAFTDKVEAITATMTGDITVYAKFVDESDISNYTVEYYKMTGDGMSYELVESTVTEGTVGVVVDADVREYNGYELNENSNVRGTVTAGDSLVLRLYYDLDINAISQPDYGIRLDENGNVICFIKKGDSNGTCIIYAYVTEDEADARNKYESTLETGNPAGIPGYIAELNNGYYEYNAGQIDGDKYVMAAYNLGKGVEEAVVSKVSEIKSESGAVKTSYTVKHYKQNDAGMYVLDTSDTCMGYAGYVAVAPVKEYDSYCVNAETSNLFGVISDAGDTVFNVYYDKVEKESLERITVEINGYQVNTRIGGMRTIYSVEESINGKEVVERGMVYSLDGFAQDKDMRVGSTSSYVKSYAATEKGVLGSNQSNSPTATSYAMTMKFGPMTKSEFTTVWKIRAYAKLTDGTYVYSDIYKYTINDIAKAVYESSSSVSKESHDYLYDKILKVVDENYESKAYISRSIVQ